MLVARTEPDLDRMRLALGPSEPVALVPTMGALHEGHLSLVRAAGADGSRVVVSIFVNPIQFEASADLARYPVDHERDLAMLDAVGCALVWLPTPSAMYPALHATAVDMSGPSLGFEGTIRPGHFRGVATVVTILIGQVRPQTIWFGEKDWQQLQVVRRMIADLRLPALVRSVSTVRAADGLALSSRNRFLSPADREAAPLIQAALRSAARRLETGGKVRETVAASRATLDEAGFAVEYLDLVDGETLVCIEQPAPGARLLLAARLGSVRLLDNIGLS